MKYPELPHESRFSIPVEIPAPADAAGTRDERGARWRRLLSIAAIVYSVTIVVLCVWMYQLGDYDWYPTMLLFGPRWLCGIPLPFLLVAAALWRKRLLWVLGVAAYVLVFPFMGCRANLPADPSTPVVIRVLTCNVDQMAVSPARLARVIDEVRPDVVALQEVHVRTRFEWPEGWHVVNHDEFTLASPWPIVEGMALPHPLMPIADVAVQFFVEMPDLKVQVFNLHLQSPRPGFEALLAREAGAAPKLDAVLETRALESESTALWMARFEGPTLIVGDFNMPCESAVFRRDWGRWTDAFSATGWGFGFTKISGARPFTYGTRIDHALCDEGWQCVRAWVAGDVGSDHLPLVAEFR